MPREMSGAFGPHAFIPFRFCGQGAFSLPRISDFLIPMDFRGKTRKMIWHILGSKKEEAWRILRVLERCPIPDSKVTRSWRRDGFRDEAGPKRSERSHPAAVKLPVAGDVTASGWSRSEVYGAVASCGRKVTRSWRRGGFRDEAGPKRTELYLFIGI